VEERDHLLSCLEVDLEALEEGAAMEVHKHIG
jgi:hypothetical protein